LIPTIVADTPRPNTKSQSNGDTDIANGKPRPEGVSRMQNELTARGKRYRCGKKTWLRGGPATTRADQEIGGIFLTGSEGLGRRLKSIHSMSKRCKVEKGREGRTAACGAGPR